MNQENNLLVTLNQLSEHLEEYLKLKGVIIGESGFHRCISPTHPDRNPSSSIGGKNEFAGRVTHCFSCGKSFSIFHAAFFFDKKPMSGPEFFQETLPYLCKLFEIAYEPIQISEDVKREYQKRRAYEDAVNVIHSGIYKKDSEGRMVLNSDHPAIKHLLDRGINEENIRKFNIGCVNKFSEYISAMNTFGWTDRTYLEAADLANQKIFSPTGIIIPIFDAKNRPVGFVTRKTDMAENSKGNEKYFNSLNSDIYHKSEILFNFNNYEDNGGPLLIVEGYLDAIYLTQMNIKNVVAIGATVLTEEHVDLLFTRKIKNLIIALDPDEGGNKGIKLAIDRLSVYKTFNVRIVELPKDNDPDNYVRTHGKDKFLELTKSDIALSPFTWMLKNTTFEDDPMETAHKAIPIIAAEESNIVRMKMIRELSRLVGIDELDIKKDVESLLNKESSRFLEELSEINNYVQVQLSRKKTKDTKSILTDSLIKIKSLERQFNNTIDNKTEFNNKINEIKNKIESGNFTYGLKPIRFRRLYEMFDGIPYGSACLSLFGGRPSAGKSFKKGTNILMFDGNIKKIEDIIIGDLLMGPDSKSRKVLKLGSGKEEMFDIIPKRGLKWSCNRSHILSLKMSSDNGSIYKKDQIFNLTIDEYLNKNNKFKHHAKLWRTGWNLKTKKVPYDPYFIGSWLGDGDYAIPKITSADLEFVEEYYQDFASKNNLIITKTLQKNKTYRLYFKLKKRKKVHPLIKYLDNSCKLNNEKRIPKEYLLNSIDNRLELLAGLIDTDGSLCRKNSHTYEITTKYEGLKNDILYLSNSLGFLTTFKIKNTRINNKTLSYFRIHISGDIHRIPVKILRKKALNISSRTNHQNIGFKLESTGIGEYYGVTLEDDHLFLLEDGTVTHNTTVLSSLLMDIVDSDDEACIFYMSIDDTTELMTLKLLAAKSGLSTSTIKSYSMLSTEDKEKIDSAWRWLEVNSERFIIADATAGNTYEALEAHVDWFCKNIQTKKKLFALDNFHKLRAGSFGRGGKKTEIVSDQSEKIKELTQLNDLHIIMTVELRKLEGTDSRPTLADLKDSVQLEYDADIIMLVHNDLQVNDNSLYVYQGLTSGGTYKSMPYLHNRVWKNKITGKCDSLYYKLNSHNLKIDEENSMIIKAIEVKAREKTSDQSLGRRF